MLKHGLSSGYFTNIMSLKNTTQKCAPNAGIFEPTTIGSLLPSTNMRCGRRSGAVAVSPGFFGIVGGLVVIGPVESLTSYLSQSQHSERERRGFLA